MKRPTALKTHGRKVKSGMVTACKAPSRQKGKRKKMIMGQVIGEKVGRKNNRLQIQDTREEGTERVTI